MKCIKCHAEIEQDAQFCPYCGTKVEHIRCCVKCGKPLDDDSDFCPYCGTRQNDVVVEPEQVEEVHSQEPELVQKELAPTPVVVEQPQEPEIVQEEPEPIPVVVEQPQEPEEKKVESEPPSNSVQEEIVDTEQAYESSQSSKKWLWIIGAILLLGILGGGGYYFMSNKSESSSYEESYVETDSIAEVGDSIITEHEAVPTNALAFLEQFYKGEYGDEGFIEQNVTANVLNKLKRDYPYDCETHDCLADWVFTAYPPGADMNLEEGPIISATDKEGVYEVEFNYSFYNGEKKGYELRAVYLTVTEMDGRYLISNYELKNTDNTIEEEQVDDGDSGSQDDDTPHRSRNDETSNSELNNNVVEDTKVYDVVDEMPQFPGGQSALSEYLSRNLKYPVSVEEKGIEGRVILTFVVERDGSISNVIVVKSIDPLLDKEAMRLAKSMPRWIPGKQQSSIVRVKYTMPVNFKLQ